MTRCQARDHLTREQLAHRLSTGRLEVFRRGVYRFTGSAPSRWQAQMAACLAAGESAVASYWAAAALWGMPETIATVPELTMPWPVWTRLEGVRAHQTRCLPESHRAIRHDVPVTSAARTLADLSALAGPRFLGRLVDDALRRRVVTLTELRAVAELLGASGRRGVPALRDALDARRAGFHVGDSIKETELVRLLTSAGLPEPVQQHQVLAGCRVYLLDLAYPDRRVGMEYDGWDAHRTRSAFDGDRSRANDLALAGWTVLRFTSATPEHQILAAVRSARERPGYDPHWREQNARTAVA
ncbi:MAG: hypothetical protein QOD63_2455 [Actinomycetota bacterium]|nr:hypothetical protein [Actinomycetota bacterium]